MVNSRVDFSLPLITGLPRSLRSLAMTQVVLTPLDKGGKRRGDYLSEENPTTADAVPLPLTREVKRAFTLAEVLITLGIIGIVAALTMPAVIGNYKKRVVVTRLKHFSSMWKQAIRMAEVEHGETKYWDGFTNEDPDAMLESYNKYLAKYIKTVDMHKTPKGIAFELANGSGFHLRKYGYNGTWLGNLYLVFA